MFLELNRKDLRGAKIEMNLMKLFTIHRAGRGPAGLSKSCPVMHRLNDKGVLKLPLTIAWNFRFLSAK
jgi:hypothetical protein